MSNLHGDISPIQAALYRNDIAELKCALAERTWDTTDPRPIFQAAECRPEIMKLLVGHGWNPNVHDDHFHHTPLMNAAKHGNADVVAVLLASGAYYSLTDDIGHNALLNAMSGKSRGHQRSMRLLLDAGIEPNPGGNVSPLMRATQDATVEMAEELIERGADVRREYPTGTALFWAIESNRIDMAALLLKHGAHPSDRFPDCAQKYRFDWLGLTALEIAGREKRRKFVELFEQFLVSGTVEDPKPAGIAESWRRIESEIVRQGVELEQCLMPGADAEDFTKIKASFKQPLPADVRASWRIHDGQPKDAYLFRLPSTAKWLEGEVGLYRILPLSEAVEEGKRQQSFVEKGIFKGLNIDAEPGIEPFAWHKGWLPVGINRTGDLWCIDTAPAEGGIRGQVILVSSESPIRMRAAESWSSLLQNVEAEFGS
jgi:cell wall assembly regulator SMI1/ankyrin repeat protein